MLINGLQNQVAFEAHERFVVFVTRLQFVRLPDELHHAFGQVIGGLFLR